MDDLLAGCLAGEGEAWGLFVERYAGVIYAAVQRTIRGRASADPTASLEDLVQNVFVRLLARDAHLLRSYDPGRASLVTWLTVVARSTALDALRKKRLAAAPLNPELQTASGADTRASLVVADIPADLLSPRQKLVLELLFDRNLAVPQVAHVLGIEAQTVRSAKHKALQRLREYFARE